MPMLVAIATGFLAIIIVGTTAAWLHDLLEARWEGLAARARRARSGGLTTVTYRAPSMEEHRRRAPAYAYAHAVVEARRLPNRMGQQARLLRA